MCVSVFMCACLCVLIFTLKLELPNSVGNLLASFTYERIPKYHIKIFFYMQYNVFVPEMDGLGMELVEIAKVPRK